MDYYQLKQPNLSVVGQEGLCLAYVTEVFGVPNEYPSATIAWEDAQYRHPNEQPPTDVSVPVWFSYNGPDGHVAVSVPGKGIYSTSVQGDKVFASIPELVIWMNEGNEGMQYLGWSEDINSVRVVEGEAMTPTSTQVGEEFQALANRQPTQQEVNLFIGLNWFDGLKQYLFPSVEQIYQQVTNLKNERDNTLYPFVNAVCASLGIPITTDIPTMAAAITALQKAGTPLNATTVEEYIKGHLS